MAASPLLTEKFEKTPADPLIPLMTSSQTEFSYASPPSGNMLLGEGGAPAVFNVGQKDLGKLEKFHLVGAASAAGKAFKQHTSGIGAKRTTSSRSK